MSKFESDTEVNVLKASDVHQVLLGDTSRCLKSAVSWSLSQHWRSHRKFLGGAAQSHHTLAQVILRSDTSIWCDNNCLSIFNPLFLLFFCSTFSDVYNVLIYFLFCFISVFYYIFSGFLFIISTLHFNFLWHAVGPTFIYVASRSLPTSVPTHVPLPSPSPSPSPRPSTDCGTLLLHIMNYWGET